MGQAMAWLLPRSLFGRLVVVLLGGLIVAQLAAAYINMAERDRLLYRAMSAMRCASCMPPAR